MANAAWRDWPLPQSRNPPQRAEGNQGRSENVAAGLCAVGLHFIRTAGRDAGRYKQASDALTRDMPPMVVVALITDLFFVTKVKSTAESVGVPLTVVRNVPDLVRVIDQGAGLAIVDMNAAGVDPAEAIRACKAAAMQAFVVAYLSHVQKDLADAAKMAGADLVMPRSKFSQELPDLLRCRAH